MAWERMRGDDGRLAADWVSGAGAGFVRIALLFGSGAVALTLLLVPVLEKQSRERNVAAMDPRARLDLMSTGSVGAQSTRYTIRRSVLQSDPHAVCIISEAGARSGDC